MNTSNFHLNNIKNALAIPEFSSIKLKYDTFHQKILIRYLNENKNYRFIEDDDYTKISLILENKGLKKLSLQNIIRITILVAKQNKFNSVRQKILKTKLKKLSKSEIKNNLEAFIIKGFGAIDTSYNRLFSLTLLTSLVKRVFKPGCQVDWLFILYGEQGIGKTRGLETMCKTFENTYIQTSLTTKDNDLSRLSIGKILIEFSELHGLATKELEAIKALISKSSYEWIEKYQIHSTKHHLTNILIGTTNEREHLTDATGNRRFLFCDVGVNNPVNIEFIEKNILQTLKCALTYLRITSWQLPYKKINEIAKFTHQNYEVISHEEEKINLWINRENHKINPETGEKSFEKSKPITWDYLVLSDILLRACNIERPTKLEQKNSIKALKKLGYERKNKRFNEQILKIWIKNS